MGCRTTSGVVALRAVPRMLRYTSFLLASRVTCLLCASRSIMVPLTILTTHSTFPFTFAFRSGSSTQGTCSCSSSCSQPERNIIKGKHGILMGVRSSCKDVCSFFLEHTDSYCHLLPGLRRSRRIFFSVQFPVLTHDTQSEFGSQLLKIPPPQRLGSWHFHISVFHLLKQLYPHYLEVCMTKPTLCETLKP